MGTKGTTFRRETQAFAASLDPVLQQLCPWIGVDPEVNDSGLPSPRREDAPADEPRSATRTADSDQLRGESSA